MILDRNKDEVNVSIFCSDFIVLQSIANLLIKNHRHVDENIASTERVNWIYISYKEIFYYSHERPDWDNDLNINLDTNPELYDIIIAELS